MMLQLYRAGPSLQVEQKVILNIGIVIVLIKIDSVKMP